MSVPSTGSELTLTRAEKGRVEVSGADGTVATIEFAGWFGTKADGRCGGETYRFAARSGAFSHKLRVTDAQDAEVATVDKIHGESAPTEIALADRTLVLVPKGGWRGTAWQLRDGDVALVTVGRAEGVRRTHTVGIEADDVSPLALLLAAYLVVFSDDDVSAAAF